MWECSQNDSKLNYYDKQKSQPLKPSCMSKLMWHLRVLILKALNVFADLSAVGSFRHNLGLDIVVNAALTHLQCMKHLDCNTGWRNGVASCEVLRRQRTVQSLPLLCLENKYQDILRKTFLRLSPHNKVWKYLKTLISEDVPLLAQDQAPLSSVRKTIKCGFLQFDKLWHV